MTDAEIESKAKDLIQQVDNVMIDVGVSGWPLSPYARLTPDERAEMQRHRCLVEWYEALDQDDDAAQLVCARKMVRLGGYTLTGGNIELGESSHRLFGSLDQFEKFGPLKDFVKDFTDEIEHWKGDQPDWDRLSGVLIRELDTDSHKLQSWDLFDIRRALVAIRQKRSHRNHPATPNRADSIDRPALHTNLWKFNGNTWTISFSGNEQAYRNTIGLRHYARILEQGQRQQPYTALQLYAEDTGVDLRRLSQDFRDGVVDFEYVANASKRQEDIEARLGDSPTADERDLLENELAFIQRVIPLWNTHRGQAEPFHKSVTLRYSERMRKALERARAVLDKAGHENLVQHLLQSVHINGDTYRYEPKDPIDWQIKVS